MNAADTVHLIDTAAEVLLLGTLLHAERDERVVEAMYSEGPEVWQFTHAGHARIYALWSRLAFEFGSAPTLNELLEEADDGLAGVGGPEYLQWLRDQRRAPNRALELATLVRTEQARRAEAERVVVERGLERRAVLADAVTELRALDINGGLEPARALEAIRRMERALCEAEAGEDSFRGMTHAEALAYELPPTLELVEGVIDAGAPGAIVALPEHYKGWLAYEIAHKVAAGGNVLGRCRVTRTGPVAYWFSDDRKERGLDRLQKYAPRHGYTGALPIRWHWNEGLVLPRDIPVLVAEIEREQQVLVVIDSYYNFLPPEIQRKEEEASTVLEQVKAEVCDATGATVCFIDHAPWPTKENRQARAYGSVFKTAAIRWWIALEKKDARLYVRSGGNNVAGLPRTGAYFDRDALELRLVAKKSSAAERIAKARLERPDATQAQIAEMLCLSERWVREHWGGGDQASLLDDDVHEDEDE